MKSKKHILIIYSLFMVFILLTFSVAFIDVKTIGQANVEVGLCFINKLVTNIGYNKILDKFSDVILLIGIGSIIGFAILGCIQLIKRKKFLKVDKEILSFGLGIIIMVLLWFVFDNVLIINYRPILIDGNVEASYPSTHVLIVTFVLLTTVNILSKYIKNKVFINIGYFTAILLISITFIFRVLSGMHWITDCLAGLILGVWLFYGYLTLCKNLPIVDYSNIDAKEK